MKGKETLNANQLTVYGICADRMICGIPVEGSLRQLIGLVCRMQKIVLTQEEQAEVEKALRGEL